MEDRGHPGAAAGQEVALPITYVEASALALFTTVGTQQAAETVQRHGLRPLTFRGRTLASVVVFDYRRTSIGPYRELALNVGVIGNGRIGAWVDQLPVTTQVSCDAGRRFWGFPKWVTSIDWRQDERSIRAQIGAELAVEARRSWLPALRLPLSFTTFTAIDGRLVRTRVRARGRVHVVPRSCARLQLVASSRLAARVKALDFNPEPMFALWIEDFRSELPEGQFVALARPEG